MSALDDIRRALELLPQLRGDYEAQVRRAVAFLELKGIDAGVRPDGAIVVSATGWELLRAMAGYPRPAAAVGSTLFGIPIYRAADWTFDPLHVAQARLAAIALLPFRAPLRALLRTMR